VESSRHGGGCIPVPVPAMNNARKERNLALHLCINAGTAGRNCLFLLYVGPMWNQEEAAILCWVATGVPRYANLMVAYSSSAGRQTRMANNAGDNHRTRRNPLLAFVIRNVDGRVV